MKHFNQTINEIRSQHDLTRFRKICEEEGKRLVLFGAGDCGHVVYRMLHNVGIQIECFCDNKTGGRIDKETGLQIVWPVDLNGKMDQLSILICAVEEEAYQSIYKQLLFQGFDKTQLHIMREYYDRLSPAYLETNLEKYKNVYCHLEDDFSKQVYLARMKKIFLMSDISQIVSPGGEEYFDKKVILSDEEVFVDCGGFNGDTALRFIEQCKGNYRNIIIFEPELCKKAEIEKNLEGNSYELYCAGVWSKSAKLYFDALETDASHVSEKDSGCTVDVVALDEVIYDKKPTFIKMDIEGSEQEALKGCCKIIKEYKPKLAICIYHKPDDLFEIPSLIKEMNPEYKLYVRQYSNSRFETVLYAV